MFHLISYRLKNGKAPFVLERDFLKSDTVTLSSEGGCVCVCVLFLAMESDIRIVARKVRIYCVPDILGTSA